MCMTGCVEVHCGCSVCAPLFTLQMSSKRYSSVHNLEACRHNLDVCLMKSASSMHSCC